MEWYQNSVIMTFLGVLLGGLISVFGTIIDAKTKIKEINLQNKYEFKNKNFEQKKEIYGEMILLTNSEYLENIEDTELKNESYLLLAKAKIYCSENVADLYEEYIENYLGGLDHRDLVETKLLSAIKKDLSINE